MDGALSTKLWNDVSDVLIVEKGTTVQINIELGNDQTSVFRVYNEVNKNHNHLRNCWNFANEVSEFKANTYRKNRKDKGNMYIVGTGMFPNGQHGLYELTNEPTIVPHLSNLSSSATNYYTDIGYKQSVNDMIVKRKHPIHDVMAGSFVSSIVVSCNLMNSFHVDVNDDTKTILTWVTNNLLTSNNWYFILPNVTRDMKTALVLKIEHGVTIEFDSTTVFHCSTSNIDDNETKLCGIVFVCRKD